MSNSNCAPLSSLPPVRGTDFVNKNLLTSNGSYYYANPNGSTYSNNGQGGSTYTSPSGQSYSQGYGGGSNSGGSSGSKN